MTNIFTSSVQKRGAAACVASPWLRPWLRLTHKFPFDFVIRFSDKKCPINWMNWLLRCLVINKTNHTHRFWDQIGSWHPHSICRARQGSTNSWDLYCRTVSLLSCAWTWVLLRQHHLDPIDVTNSWHRPSSRENLRSCISESWVTPPFKLQSFSFFVQ